MAKRIEGTIESLGESTRRFRTTEVTIRDFKIARDGGGTEVWPELRTELDVVRELRTPARGTLYVTDVKGARPQLFGIRLAGQAPTFDAGAGFDSQIANLFLLVLGIAFFWTGIGLWLAWSMWKQRRVFADGKRARALFDEDGKRG
jgi:hypothetical protein